MILVIDVGNTNITFGVYESKKLVTTFRMTSRTMRTSDEYGTEILAMLQNNQIDRRELYEMIVRHAQLSCTYKGEYITVREMRKHLAWYTTGLPHAAGLRRQINSMETMEELMEGMKLLLEA